MPRPLSDEERRKMLLQAVENSPTLLDLKEMWDCATIRLLLVQSHNEDVAAREQELAAAAAYREARIKMLHEAKEAQEKSKRAHTFLVSDEGRRLWALVTEMDVAIADEQSYFPLLDEVRNLALEDFMKARRQWLRRLSVT